MNVKAGVILAASAVPLLGLRLHETWSAKAPSAGRKLPRVKASEHHLAIKIGDTTGKLAERQHEAGLRKGQSLILRDEDLCLNIMIFGGIGSGKTVAAMVPVMKQAAAQQCGIVAVDMKGSFHREALKVGEATGRDVRVIGFGKNAESVDLCDGMPPAVLAMHISSMLSLTDKGRDSEAWINTGVNLSRGVAGLLWQIKKHYDVDPYGLPGIYRYLFVKGWGSPALDSKGQPIRVGASIDEKIEHLVESLAATCDGLDADDPKRAEYYADLREIETSMQEVQNYATQTDNIKRGVEFSLNQLLAKMIVPEVEDAFFCKKPYARPFCFADTYIEGAFFAINAPIQIMGPSAPAIVAMNKSMFFEAMEMRRIDDDADRERYVGFFGDECQAFVTCSANGEMSDHTALATLRDTKAFCVWATQSTMALRAKLGNDMTEALLANFRQKITFRNEDAKTIEDALKLLGEVEVEKQSTSRTMQPGKWGASKGASKNTQAQAVARAELFRNLKRWQALFIGTIDGESADDVITCTPEFLS